MKASYDEENRDREELMLLDQEIDVDKFLMELEDEELVEYEYDSKGEGVDGINFNHQVMRRIDEYYPQTLDVQVIEGIQKEMCIRGRERLMIVYIALVVLSMALFSSGIFKGVYELFIKGI
ncbi:hypothetical protein [Oceanirhabdus sp. W0125-5]|uniref:hypothetical protein n=1 Tax=Oceanirhabdus sp. W0125-5 TaxID=2999116 RepID=UPI0022F2AB9A|nr:hypothetical protein [Oceanirhabdus sp. W0125-5]WBW97456.1 hypothetical protein OW730_00955 [Oceanirhabdus sp. W0125-5]